MKAAIIKEKGQSPVYGDYADPEVRDGAILIDVTAAGLSQFSRSRSQGTHYSTDAVFPHIAGAEGVGTMENGQRVYFVMPVAPYGAFAEKTLVPSPLIVPIPDELDDVTAAAIANPAMSAWVAMEMRARMTSGETVLINGATGTAGQLCVQLAKYFGAKHVIASGRNQKELEQLRALGADVVIPFHLDGSYPSGASEFEEALKAEFVRGIDVVVDYLWGESALTIMRAVAHSVKESHPVRFVNVGRASREKNIELPSDILRSCAIQLMGSGVGSVPLVNIIGAIRNVFAIARRADLQISTRALPLTMIEHVWDTASGKPRVIFTM